MKSTARHDERITGRISLVSVLVCVGIVLMAVIRQYLGGQY